MRKWIILPVVLVMTMSVMGLAQSTPAPVMMPAAMKPNYLAVDQLVINLNAVAGMRYEGTKEGGTVTITYLNGYTGSYAVKMTPEEWGKAQEKMVSAGNK